MDKNIHLRNYTEVVVNEVIEKLWIDLKEICKCQRCRLDTKAIALNNLPNQYTVTERGETYAKINSFRNQVYVDVMREVIKAINIVNNNYSHPLEEVVGDKALKFTYKAENERLRE